MALDTIGSIATHIASSFVLPEGVSGNLIPTVDMARADVENFVGQNIGSNSIEEAYQPPIVNFSKAQALDEAFMWAATFASSGTANIGGGTAAGLNLKLAELSVGDETSTQQADALRAISTMSKDTAKHFRDLAQSQLKNIGRRTRFARSLS